MQIPHPQIHIKAKDIFKRIYRNEKIDVKASRQLLRDQLDLYLDHLAAHLGKKVANKDTQRIMDIIIRNNHVAEILDSREFKRVTEKKKELLGPTSLGLVFCIDGRIPAIFLGGRFASHWEVPAGEITVVKRKSDGKLIPESSELCESLRKLVNQEKDVLEIVFAHTSFIEPTHGCGAMAAKKAAGLIDAKLSLEEANLKIIEEKTIPAITNVYNDFREQKGFEVLPQVGISAIYDTDTFGVVLNYDKRDKGQMLSTTQLANTFQEAINDYFVKDNLVFGAYRDKFTYLKYLNPFSANVLKITEALLSASAFTLLRDTVSTYIKDMYQNLSEEQKKALLFFILRTVAFQYLTGGCSINKKSLNHAFAHHEETSMAVSTRGITIGKFDPQMQIFSSTPADTITAVGHIKTKLSIMSHDKHNKNRSYILFVCNPVNPRDLQENSVQLHKIMDNNAELFRAIVADKDLGAMIEEEKLLPISVLIEEETREVLKINDHSAYI